MRVIYYSIGKSHAPQITAAIHLRLLPMDRHPSSLEWNRIPYRYGFSGQDQGRLLFAGRYCDWEVYLLPLTGKTEKMVPKVLRATLDLTTISNQIILCPCGKIPLPPMEGGKPREKWLERYYMPLVMKVKETEGDP